LRLAEWKKMAGFAISNFGNSAIKKEPGRERRISDRYPMGDARGTLIYSGEKNTCNVIDISLDGCLIRTHERFPYGALAYVEVDLHIYGLILHIGGVTQWTHKEHLIGVRFIHPTMRAKNELAGLLTCLVDSDAVEEIKEAIAEANTDRILSPILSAEHPVVKKPKLETKPSQKVASNPSEASTAEPAQQAPIPATPVPLTVQTVPIVKIAPPESEPEYQPTEALGESDDWSADLHFLKDGSHLHGTVVDLGMDGCGFQMAYPYAGDYPCRIEVEFKMRGLPFRLGGVTEPSGEECVVGIHFLDLSPRSQQQLAQLLEEIWMAAQIDNEKEPDVDSLLADHSDLGPLAEPDNDTGR